MSKTLPKITIAIDGFSSTGKSTVAKKLAKELGYIYVDTGAMYRAITLYAIQNKFIGNAYFKKDVLIKSLPNILIAFVFNKDLGFAEMFLNHNNVENAIRTIEVSNYVSQVAEVSAVRKYLVELQRQMGKNKGVVMDGRDIGSVVFPNAELKIFLTADPKIRANRRLLEMNEKGELVDFDTIYKNIIDRDQIDSNRLDSPLIIVDDAIEIDASNINKEEQFTKILGLAHKVIINKLTTDSLFKKSN